MTTPRGSFLATLFSGIAGRTAILLALLLVPLLLALASQHLAARPGPPDVAPTPPQQSGPQDPETEPPPGSGERVIVRNVDHAAETSGG